MQGSRSRKQGAKAPAGSRREPKPELTDQQWLLIAHFFPKTKPSPLGGRPRAADRPCVEGILWVLRTGARWKDLPAPYPSGVTCWRRLQKWTALGLWTKIWASLVRTLDERGSVKDEVAIGDGTFAAAKKGGSA